MSKITIKDISKALKVSISTVSKALSDSHEISVSTKNRVKAYAKEHDFSINKVAQSLKLGRSNTIGVIACSINNDFVTQILDGIQEASIETKYDIIIMQSMEDIKVEKSCIEVLKSRGIDGLLISPVSETSNLDLLHSLKNNNMPIVLFDRINSGLDAYKFGIKNFEGAYQATMHLLKQGNRNIFHITGSKLSIAGERLSGFKAAIQDFGLTFNPLNYITCDLKDVEKVDQTIREAIVKAKEQGNMPDAIFGATDLITIRIIGVLAEMEIAVPHEIAVIGFANTKSAFAFNPALSTITQPAKDIGYLAMNQLVKIIKTKRTLEEFETVELDTNIQIRKSSSITRI